MCGVMDVFTSKDVSFNEVKTGNAEVLKTRGQMARSQRIVAVYTSSLVVALRDETGWQKWYRRRNRSEYSG